MKRILEYTSSDDDDDEIVQKKIKLVQLPKEFQSSSNSTDRSGLWPTFVYIPIQNKIIENMNFFDKLHIEKQQLILSDYHVSLSKTVYCQYHQIQPLTDELKIVLQKFNKFNASISRIAFMHGNVTNLGYVVLDICKGNEIICEMISAIDKVMEKFGLEKFYKNPRPHISIASTPVVDQYKNYEILKDIEEFDIEIETVHCKCGNRLYQFDLQ